MKTNDYVCRKALPKDSVSAIARYVHLTDPYIYPTITKDPDDLAWRELIRSALAQEDTLFSLSNFSVVLHNGSIVGIACIIPCGKRLTLKDKIAIPESLREGFAKVDEGYFSPLIEESAAFEGYNITNVCIDEAHRRKGVASLLLQHCIEEYGSAALHLDVIADNDAAVCLYKKYGFVIAHTYSGFSGGDHMLPCYHMIRKPFG